MKVAFGNSQMVSELDVDFGSQYLTFHFLSTSFGIVSVSQQRVGN
jgi:hypothetical protein